MKLSKQSITHLKALLQAVAIPKIDKIVIENGQARGVDDDQTVAIISDTNIPDFGGKTVGLNRLSTLVNRLNLLESIEDLQVEAVEQGDSIASFNISAKGTKFQYKCARADVIKAPKKLYDDFKWLINIDADSIKLAISAANTMDSEQIALCSKSNGEVYFEIVDGITKDTFTSVIAIEASWIPEDEDRPTQSFVHYYAIKTLIPLLKAISSGPAALVVGEAGMLQITVNNAHTFTLLPRENE